MKEKTVFLDQRAKNEDSDLFRPWKKPNDLRLNGCIGRRNLELKRKEVSMEPPQYNGDLLGLQKRDYLASLGIRAEGRRIADMLFRS